MMGLCSYDGVLEKFVKFNIYTHTHSYIYISTKNEANNFEKILKNCLFFMQSDVYNNFQIANHTLSFFSY